MPRFNHKAIWAMVVLQQVLGFVWYSPPPWRPGRNSRQLGCRTMLPDFPFRLQPVIHVVSVHAAALFKEFIGALGDPPVQIVRG